MSKSRYSGPAPKPVILGELFRELREKQGLTLRAVADKARMDLAHLQKIELGDRLPTPEQAARLSRFFKLDETEIQARRIAQKFYHEYAENPAAKEAIGILAEEAGIYGAGGKGERVRH
ncbi:MAG TPA: helix-turn-helix transcriptional regulator [Verrucomicrobiae bacterium]|nr:helix-turn-helix transcriptional regulator [Verrucomicrobiae bacterium]